MSFATWNLHLELTGVGMTLNLSVTAILPKVRQIVLSERATADRPYVSIGLSWLTWQLGETRNAADWRLGRSRFTSGGLKSIRGHAQAALALLAREGIMYSRIRPEPGVQSYEHSERDKYFHVRISQTEAKRRLARMK